jgi:hypothetical protein
MKTVCLILTFVGLAGAKLLAQAEADLSFSEIHRLSVAVALVDYPIAQGKFRSEIGLPDSVRPSFGHASAGLPTFHFFPLKTLADESYYALRIVFSDERAPTADEIKIMSMEIVFVPHDWLPHFVVDPDDGYRSDIKRLKELMKKSGLSVKEFTSRERLPEFYLLAGKERLEEARAALQSKKKPNQPSEPTAPSGRGSP